MNAWGRGASWGWRWGNAWLFERDRGVSIGNTRRLKTWGMKRKEGCVKSHSNPLKDGTTWPADDLVAGWAGEQCDGEGKPSRPYNCTIDHMSTQTADTGFHRIRRFDRLWHEESTRMDPHQNSPAPIVLVLVSTLGNVIGSELCHFLSQNLIFSLRKTCTLPPLCSAIGTVLSQFEAAFLPKVARTSRQELPVKGSQRWLWDADKNLGGLGFPTPPISGLGYVHSLRIGMDFFFGKPRRPQVFEFLCSKLEIRTKDTL